MVEMPKEIWAVWNNSWSLKETANKKGAHNQRYPRTKYIRADLVNDTAAARESGRCLILSEQRDVLAEALLTALPYVEDVLSNPEQLACFKKGAVQRDVKQIKDALKKAGV